MDGVYKKLVVANPTLEELATNKIPDICLDEIVLELRDTKGTKYTLKYFPNDYLGAYGSFASKKTSAQRVHAHALQISCGLDLDEVGVLSGYKQELFYLQDQRPNPQIRDQVGVSQSKLADYIRQIQARTDLWSAVTILSAVYSRIPEIVYVYTGFAPNKLDWTQ